MPTIRTLPIQRVAVLAIAASLFSGLGISNAGSEEARAPSTAACKTAIVNPVSGYAECVDPLGAAVDPPPPRPAVVKLAVFDFELDDSSPAAAILGSSTSSAAAMDKVNEAARHMFERSGRYLLIDVSGIDAAPVKEKVLRNCDGCEAPIALNVGADQALVGVVKRITQTDYYVNVQITDARTGKILNQQSANFAGGPDGWASGVRMLLKHQVLEVAGQT
jgi:Protein of unknown function (DUF2380)